MKTKLQGGEFEKEVGLGSKIYFVHQCPRISPRHWFLQSVQEKNRHRYIGRYQYWLLLTVQL